MKSLRYWIKRISKLGWVALLGASMSACSTTWKEEVLLHDGSKIIVERSVERGGPHELGQKPPYKWQKLDFTMPVTGERVTWEDNYSQDIGTASFLPRLLDVHRGSAYVVADPMGCLSYNKWGRPNPPYVIFQYQNKAWRRITLQELPTEIRATNLILFNPDTTAKRTGENPVSAKSIQEIIASYRQPASRTILREALAKRRIDEMCEERVLYKGYWILPDDHVAKDIIDQRKK